MKTKNLLKKAFLLLALMGGASSAWAGDVQFSAKNNATSDQSFTNGTTEITANITISGGKIYAVNNQSSAKNLQTSSGFCMTNNNTYFKIVLNRALAVGDIISAKYTGGIKESNNETYEKGIRVSSSETTSGNLSPIPACSATSSSDTKLGSTLSYTVQVGDEYVGKTTLYVYRAAGATQYFDEFKVTSAAEPTSEVLKSSSAVKVGESTLTKDAATNGYSVDGTTITLSNDISAVSAPTNVALVKTITYDDESTKDEDVDVTFDGTITEGYYIGTASIGLTGSVTNYTVKVKKSVVPTATLSETSGTISMPNSYTVIGSTTVTLTGGNLTNGEYTVTADQAGTTISPSSFTVADGSVDQEFTITTSGSSAATTVFTFGTSGMGVAAPTYTLTYETVAKRSLSQADVSTATTWDWKNAGSNSIQLTDGTNPTKSVEFLLSDLQEIPNSGDFNSQALKVICEWPNRGNNSYIQVNSIKFNATVPGTVQVWFSNTGSRTDEPAQRRYLYVNNTNSDVYSLNTTMTNTDPMPVSAGEVVINAYTGTEVATMVRINKIIFTPVSSVSKTITSAGWATYCSPYALDFSSSIANLTKAYIVTGATGSTLNLEEITGTIPANTGILIEAPEGTVTIPVVASADAVSGNKLVGVTSDTEIAANDGYVLMADPSLGFYKNANAFTVGANTAYLPANFAGSARSAFFFGGNITGVENVEAAKVKALPVKRIVNGKLVIENEGDIFNAFGQKLSK